MFYKDKIRDLSGDPEQLEEVYHASLKAGDTEDFRQAIAGSHAEAPNNLLYAAWFHRLKYSAAQVKRYVPSWAWVVPLALINGFLFWLLSGDQFMVTIEGYHRYTRDLLPAIVLLAAPISALFVLIYQTAVGRKAWRLSMLVAILLLAAGVYVLLIYPRLGTVPFQEQYITLMVMHLPLLAWAGVGVFLTAGRRDAPNRFAFLFKSLEIIVIGGMFAAAGLLFTGITVALFDTLSVQLPDEVMRLFFAGGLGVIIVLVVALFYDPTRPPAEQSFDEGLSKLLALLMRVLLPLTLLVLVAYLLFIPFNFRAPFEDRDVLIIYNVMLFAVVALLVGATPTSLRDISPRMARWLRMGITAVAALALLVSLYALAAILYRTAFDRLTPNRLTFTGWNVVNIGLLLLLLVFQARAREGRWLHELHRAFSAGTAAYAAWTLLVILAIPWLFGIDQGAVEELPVTVQGIIYDHADPILLKCHDSPHIYLLDQGEKRWIDTIETFNDQGYVWRDVHFILCDDLRSIPDGVPIPAGAGPPPQP